MSDLLRALFMWLKQRRPAFLRPSLDSRRVQRALKERVARQPSSWDEEGLEGVRLGARLDVNLTAIKQLAGDAPDLVVRELSIAGGVRGAVVFFDTLSDADRVAQQVIRPLLYDALWEGGKIPTDPQQVAGWIRLRIIHTADLETLRDVQQLLHVLCYGKVAVLVEGLDEALVLDLIGYDTRNVEEPMGEPVVRGPRDGFVDNLQINMSLIRRRIGSPMLRFDQVFLGRWTQTRVVIAYIHGLASEELLQEVRRRVSAIDVAGVIDSSYIEEFIEDTPYTVFPQVLNTERPDTVVANLLEGRVAILADGTPFALVVPTTLWALMSAAEDYYQRWDGATLVRILRYVLVVLLVLLPSSYVAATTFHPEMLPSAMLISIAAAREAVPFSSFTEVLLMEITLEALREAGVRLPRPVGQTIGIVGAIVIGEAAVSAQIVSAPVVIIVAFTGISSFVIPHFNIGIGFRLARFYILFLAGSLGLLGVSIGLMLLLLHLIALRSFGQPYLAPVSPMRWQMLADTFVRLPHWLLRRRPEPIRAPTVRQQNFPAPGVQLTGSGSEESSSGRSRPTAFGDSAGRGEGATGAPDEG